MGREVVGGRGYCLLAMLTYGHLYAKVLAIEPCDSVHIGTIRGRWDLCLLYSRILFQCA